jgi:hypothetical protein
MSSSVMTPRKKEKLLDRKKETKREKKVNEACDKGE